MPKYRIWGKRLMTGTWYDYETHVVEAESKEELRRMIDDLDIELDHETLTDNQVEDMEGDPAEDSEFSILTIDELP